MKSGNLNFLEPSGPLQVWKGNALPFTKLIMNVKTVFRLLYDNVHITLCSLLLCTACAAREEGDVLNLLKWTVLQTR